MNSRIDVKVHFYVLEGGQLLFNVHDEEKCAGQSCAVHHLTRHHMRCFPQHFRADRGFVERTCPHGIGHPDPDDPFADPVHGCDGCCSSLICHRCSFLTCGCSSRPEVPVSYVPSVDRGLPTDQRCPFCGWPAVTGVRFEGYLLCPRHGEEVKRTYRKGGSMRELSDRIRRVDAQGPVHPPGVRRMLAFAQEHDLEVDVVDLYTKPPITLEERAQAFAAAVR